MAEQRDIKYVNREFGDFKEQLVEFAKSYFPDSYNDFNETAPGMMFIISVNKISNACWYVLNQSDLDRGPGPSMNSSQCDAKTTGNTWGCNN